MTIRRSVLLLFGLAPFSFAEITVRESEDLIVVSNGSNDFLCYHKAPIEPPAGVDPVFRRSGVLHPIKTPSNGVITGIHPADHFHHIGVWHAWVQTIHGLDKPDFWNLKKETGLVRFSKMIEKTQNGFTVEQEQVAFKGAERAETVILKEHLRIRAAVSENANVIDYEMTQTNISGVKLVLPAYRYGGPLAYRGPLNWNKSNSNYLTSDGKDRKNSHATRAKWCLCYGDVETGKGSILFLCHPDNHDAPQRLRTWDDGKVFLNWVPVQEQSLAIGAGDSVIWKFRLVVADGVISRESADQWWSGYSK